MKKKVLSQIGMVIGVLSYLALLFSALSPRLDGFIYEYYKFLGMYGGDALVHAWKGALAVYGALMIWLSCWVFTSRFLPWQKGFLLTGLLLVTALWSPVLGVWGVSWSPVLLIVAMLWGVFCTWLIARFTPEFSNELPDEEYYIIDAVPHPDQEPAPTVEGDTYQY